MDINSRYLQVNGKLEATEDFKFQQDMPVVVSVYEVANRDNQDGSVDRIYKAKLIEILENEVSE